MDNNVKVQGETFGSGVNPPGTPYPPTGKSKVKEAIFYGFIRKDESNNQTIVIHIRPRNGKAKNFFSNKDWKKIRHTALAAIRAPLKQKNEMIKNFVQKNDETASFLSNLDNPKAVPSKENCKMTSLTKMVVKEAIFQGFIRKEKLVIHIKPKNGKAKNVFSNKDWRHICYTVLAALRAPSEQKNKLIKNFIKKNDGTTSSLSNLDNPEAIPFSENCYMTSMTKMDINHVQKNKMIKNFDQKNDRTTSSLSNIDNLEAVLPTSNCSMTSLTKMVKNHEQKNEMIKNFDQKNDRTTSSLSNLDNLEAVPNTANCSITFLTKMIKNHEQKNELIKNFDQQNDRTMSSLSNSDNLEAVLTTANYSMTSLTKMVKNHDQKNNRTTPSLSNFDNPEAVPPEKNYVMTSLTNMDKNRNLQAPKVRKSTRIGRGRKDCSQACSGCMALKPNQPSFNLPKLDKKPTKEPLERQVKKSFLKILNSVISSPKTDNISVSYSSDTKVQIKRKFETFEGSASNEASNEASKADPENNTKNNLTLEDKSQGQSKSLNNKRRKIKPTPKTP